ncbi:MAG: ATP-binding protein [Candidatus Omnitrophota bacterium]
MVGKRGGNDSPSTVSIEMRVLREAGLIESYRVNKSGQIFYFLPEWALELDPEEILAKVPEFEETNPIAKISKIKRKITHLKRKVVKEAGLSESEEGEAVINTETHSAGMKDRPVMSIRTTLWKVYQMFPDLKITFKWRKSQISITEAPSISDFSPLRDISYKGKMKIIIAGPYAKGTLNKIAALVEKLIHEEKFMQGFSPDGRVIEIGYSIYSGAMLKNEIDTDIKALGMSSTNFGWPKSPPGNPMTLLQYMFGYDFKEGRFVPENLTGRNNPKKSADMVDKRGGKDSPATIRLEVKVLREAGLIEGSGRKGYYIPEWVIEYGLDRVMAEIEELNVPKPKEKQMEAIKDKVDRIKAQISMEEAGTAKFKGPEKKKKKDPAERRVELAKKLKDLKAKLPKGIEATVDVLAEVSEGKLTPQQILNEAKELGIDLAVLGIATKAMPEREKWMRRLRALLLKLPKGAEPTERALAKASKGALTGKQIGEVLHDHNITLGEIGAAGMNEVVLEAETHSGGIHHRPTEALVYICVRLQDILPVAEIIFIGSDETVRIKNPRTTAACFDPLRRLGEKEKGRYVYRGKIKIIVSGAYPEGELKKAASILQVLIKDERFTYGIEPDVYTEGPDGKQYTGEMLKIEIDKKLNELEALKKSRLADLATKTQLLDTTIPKTLADLEREMRINNRCITFYWKEMSGHSKLRPGNELRQALTEVTSIGDELDQLLNVVQTRRDTGKGMNVGSRKEIFDLVREINESASGFHFAITYLLMSGPKSYVAQNLVSKLENIMEICGQILPGEGAEEREEEEFEEEEAPVIPQKVSKEPEASRRKRDEALPPIRDELVSAKFTLVDILTSAELFVDKDRETELVRDVISTENKKFLKELISLLEDLKKNREKITKNILIEAGEIRKAAERCREPFETIIKVSSSAGVGKGNIFYIRLVKMAEMLAKIKALCDDIAPPKKKAPPDGAPYSIFNKLQIKFKGRYATTEEVRKLTKGRYKDGHLSPDVVEEDLKTLVFLGLVKRSDDGKRYKALDLSPSEWEEVSRVLLSLGSRPKKTQKEAAAKKLAEMFSRKARESALAEETPVEKDIREYSLKYGSDDPFMILGVALTKVNWPVVRYYVYYLSDLVKKGRPMSVLQEHILLRAEHALKEYRKKVQALDDWVRDEGKPPAEGSPAKCIGTLFLNENLRKKTDISVRKDLLPERKKEKPNIVRQTVQKEVEMLVKLGILVEGTKPHTYQLRPELQNLPPPEGNELPKVLKKICEVRHEGIGWLGRPKIPQEIIPIIRSKIESCITTEKAITVRSPGGISEEQALAIKKIADSLWDKWKISVFIGRDDGTGTCSATDVSGMCGLGIKNRENVKVAVKGFHDEKMMGKAMNIIEGLLHNPYALLYYTVDPRLHESYFKAVEKLSEVPHFKTSFECGHDVFYGDSAWYQALLKRLEGYGIKHTVTVKRKNLVTIELEGGRSEQQLRQVAAFMRKVLEERPSDHFSAHDPLDREKRAFVLVVHNMLPAILGGEIKFDFPKKEMEGSEKHPFFPNEKLSWTVNPKVGNIAFTLGQSAWGRYEIFVTKDGKKVYVAPYLEDITPRTPVEYFSMDISDPRLLAGSLAYHYDGKQVLLGEMLPGASLGPEDKINRNRIVGVLVEALSLRIEMTKRPNLNYYFMIDRVHGDENMDIVSRNVLETGELPHTIGVVEKGTPIPDFYATDQDRRLALLVEAGAYTPEQLAEKLFNGYWNLCKSLDVANELVLGLSIRGVKKPGEFGKKARRLANLFLLQLEYKRRKGEEVKLPETITVEDAYRNMRVTYRVDPEILKTDKPSSVKRYDDISRIANLHEFMFRSEKILDERKRKDEQKKKTKRVKELFGENVVAGELDLDPDFHRVIEELRRAEFLRGNEGGVEILNWVPHTIMLSALLECTARCAHCLEASAPKRPEKMSFSDIGRALDTRDIAVNSPVATIVGGEILLRKDLIEIISRYPIYALTTNASEMDTPKIAREFVIALKDAFEKRRNVMAKGFLISESKLRECQDDPYLMHWANYTRDRDFELSRRQSDDFSIYISLDNLHMAQRRISADKICNLVEAIIDHYPKAKLGFIALEKNWEKALDNVEKKFRDRGFSFSYDPKKSRYIVSRKSDGQTKVISITTEDISRQGRALYLPDRYFSEINMESDIEKAIKEFHPPRLARVTLNYEGRLTVFDSWISEHGPLFFGNVIREGWDTVLKRLDKDPLFRVISGFPQDKLDLRYVLEIANEYEPGIVEKILEGKPGDLGAFVYWLFSNPERKLYITYRLLNEYYEKGILKGESPHAGMSNDEIKVLVKEQVAELRTEFVRRKKIDFIDKYYRTRKGLTKSKSAEGRAFLPSGTDDVVLVAERFLRGKPEARVLDLGAGNAKALSILSLYARVTGDEIDPELFAEGKTCIDEFSRHGIVDKSRIDLTQRDFLKTEKGEFSRYDLIYTYWPFSIWGSEEGERLKKRLLEEMDPDAILVVNRASRDLHEDLSAEFEEVEFPGEEEDSHPRLRAYCLRRESYATGYEGTGFGREGAEGTTAKEEAPKKVDTEQKEPARLDLRSLIDERISKTFKYRRSTELIKKLPENIYVTIQPSAWLEQGGKKKDFIKEWRTELILILDELFTNALEGRSGDFRDLVSEEVSRVRIEAKIEDGSIVFTVEDDAPGIPEEGMKNVKLLSEDKPLDPDASTKGRPGGFGLAVTLPMAKYVGGDIEIKTRRKEDYKYKKGTTACLRIPAEVVHIPSDEEVKSANMLEKIKIEERDSGIDWEKGIVKDFCDIVMARLLETADKEQKQNIIIGVDTSWIPFDQNSGKVDALLREVKKKFKLLTKMNAGEVMIVSESGDKLAERIDAVANDEKTKTDYSNVAILGSSVTLNSTEFDKFADEALLIEVEADYFSLEMFTLALKMLAGYPDPETHDIAVIQDEKKGPRYYYFKAEPVDPDELVDKYELQTRLLEKHA